MCIYKHNKKTEDLSGLLCPVYSTNSLFHNFGVQGAYIALPGAWLLLKAQTHETKVSADFNMMAVTLNLLRTDGPSSGSE